MVVIPTGAAGIFRARFQSASRGAEGSWLDFSTGTVAGNISPPLRPSSRRLSPVGAAFLGGRLSSALPRLREFCRGPTFRSVSRAQHSSACGETRFGLAASRSTFCFALRSARFVGRTFRSDIIVHPTASSFRTKRADFLFPFTPVKGRLRARSRSPTRKMNITNIPLLTLSELIDIVRLTSLKRG